LLNGGGNFAVSENGTAKYVFRIAVFSFEILKKITINRFRAEKFCKYMIRSRPSVRIGIYVRCQHAPYCRSEATAGSEKKLFFPFFLIQPMKTFFPFAAIYGMLPGVNCGFLFVTCKRGDSVLPNRQFETFKEELKS